MRKLPWFWVVCREPEELMDPLTVSVPGLGEALALFCFEEEAELYLGHVSERLRPRPVDPAELMVLLLGSWSRFELITLDPMPGNDVGIMLRLASMRRDEFLRHLAHKQALMRQPPKGSPALS